MEKAGLRSGEFVREEGDSGFGGVARRTEGLDKAVGEDEAGDI